MTAPTTMTACLLLDVEETGIHSQARKALENVGVKTVRDIVAMTKHEFRNTPGLGRVSRQKITTLLESVKLDVGMKLEQSIVEEVDREERRLMRQGPTLSGIEKRVIRLRRR